MNSLTPVTQFDSPIYQFDFPSVQVGVAEYEEGPTGCTVIRFPSGSTGLADVRGGSPATILSHREGWIDAVCLAGGSVYGLEATTGVSAHLLDERSGDTDWMKIAIVSGAVIYDFNSLRHDRSIYPDRALGRAAVAAARPGEFPIGTRGAGRCATVGKWLRAPYKLESGGQGAAFAEHSGVKVAVFTVVNSVGAIIDRSGKAVRGHRHDETGNRARVAEGFEFSRGDDPESGNTTLTVVVINQSLELRELRQLAREVHSSMARAIEPFHTLHDGDILYAVTTNEVETPSLKYFEVSHIASELAWDAVLRSYEEE